ncbi:MAG: hypothetical protein JW730_09815 [Anaerolineales bacterium]|nr:hypothetical protein [Anaerolineales bacterium]
MNRKRWITGAVLLVLLLILCISGTTLAWKEWKGEPGSVGTHEPLPGFGYCSSRPSRPCILSFRSNWSGDMVINLLVNGSSPDFHIKIRHAEGEYIYECKRARKYSINVSCTGETLPVGETFSFLVISTEAGTTLAEGSFPIIGMALATPETYFTPTPFTHRDPR